MLPCSVRNASGSSKIFAWPFKLEKKILKECPFWFHAEELENVGLKFQVFAVFVVNLIMTKNTWNNFPIPISC
jgi:hypothetical protein